MSPSGDRPFQLPVRRLVWLPLGIAAVLAGKLPPPAGPVATILTGRNLDMGLFHRLMAGDDIRLGDKLLKGKRYGA